MEQIEIKDVIGDFIDEAFDYSDNEETIKAFLAGMIAALPIIMRELNWQSDDTASTVYPGDNKSAITMICSDSSIIDNIEYWDRTKELFIQFKKTYRIYAYQNVPLDIFNGLVGAESKGKYFNQNIKGKFEYVDVTEKGDLK